MKNVIVISSVLVSLSGCASIDKLTDTTNGVNYKNSHSIKSLEFPPDLTSPEFDNAFVLPASGSVSASVMKGQTATTSDHNINVLPIAKNMRIGESGNVRWLDVDASANSLWPQIRDFWRSLGMWESSQGAPPC